VLRVGVEDPERLDRAPTFLFHLLGILGGGPAKARVGPEAFGIQLGSKVHRQDFGPVTVVLLRAVAIG
jgi:hypothetical protein